MSAEEFLEMYRRTLMLDVSNAYEKLGNNEEAQKWLKKSGFPF